MSMPAVIKADAVKRGEARGLTPFALTDIMEEARATLANARATAVKLMADARTAAVDIRAKAALEGVEEGRARGLTEGRDAGHKEAFEAARAEFAGQQARLVSSFTQAVEGIDRSRAAWEAAARQDLIELAVAIARRVVGPVGRRDREVILRNLEEVVRLTGVRSEVSLLVHPLDAEASRQFAGEVERRGRQWQHVRIIEDESVSPGGCRVQWGSGGIDAELETQLDRIAAELTAGTEPEGGGGDTA